MLNAQKSNYYLVIRLQEILMFFLLCISIFIFSSFISTEEGTRSEMEREKRKRSKLVILRERNREEISHFFSYFLVLFTLKIKDKTKESSLNSEIT